MSIWISQSGWRPIRVIGCDSGCFVPAVLPFRICNVAVTRSPVGQCAKENGSRWGHSIFAPAPPQVSLSAGAPCNHLYDSGICGVQTMAPAVLPRMEVVQGDITKLSVDAIVNAA